PLAGDPLSARTWFGIPYDCTTTNQSPYWDTASHGDDPVLVRDDEVGQGPEEIRIDEPSTSHSYDIGVHWYSSRNRNRSQQVTTRVYCGGTEQVSVQDTLPNVYAAVDVGAVSWNGDGTCSFVEHGGMLTVIP